MAKCAECHGPDLTRPKGRFGFVNDLAKVAEKYVTPNDVEDSELWFYLTGELDLMPPKKAKAGPLTTDEFALIRWWITAGAPAPKDVVPEASKAEANPDEGNPVVAASHVLLVHFPIALIWAALLAELLAMTGRDGFAGTARFCLVLALLSAFLTAWSGWAAGDAFPDDPQVDDHRWLGVAGLSALACASLLIPAARKGGRGRVFYRLMLLVAGVLIALTGHLGGELVHGVGHLLG